MNFQLINQTINKLITQIRSVSLLLNDIARVSFSDLYIDILMLKHKNKKERII